MLKSFFFSVLMMMPFLIFANDSEPDSVTFLAQVRRTPIQENWGKLSGEMTHIRRNQGVSSLSTPIYLGIRAAPTRVFAQLVLADSEAYTVSQRFGDNPSTSVLPLNWSGAKLQLPMFGVKPEDLTFSFLYWNLEKELDRETKKMQSCRIFELKSPDQNEFVKVWISTGYGMPMRVEWFKAGDAERYRALEVAGVAKDDNGLWMVSELSLDGPGWRTRIVFPNRKAGAVSAGVPTDLFRVKPQTDSSLSK